MAFPMFEGDSEETPIRHVSGYAANKECDIHYPAQLSAVGQLPK